MAGHCHPAVVAAVQERLVTGTMYGMPHTLEYELAEEICQRFPVEQVRFGSSGTEVTMHAIRIARGFTGRDKIIKMEGAYHGVHDSVLVSMKPKLELVRRSRPAQPGTGLGRSSRRHGEEHAGGAVQRSQCGRRSVRRESGPDRRRHRGTHHDEHRHLHAGAGISGRAARDLHPRGRAAHFRRGEDRRQAGPRRSLRVLQHQGRHRDAGQVHRRRLSRWLPSPPASR